MEKVEGVSIQERVHNGVTMLNQKLGHGWELLIDLKTFDIEDGDSCVLGQVFKPQLYADNYEDRGRYREAIEDSHEWAYGDGITALFANLNGAAQDFMYEEHFAEFHGFDHGHMGYEGSWDDLNKAWKKHIKAVQDRFGSRAEVNAYRKQALKRIVEKELAAKGIAS